MEEIIASPSVTRKILKKYNINLKKKMGQNLLIKPGILDKIIAAADIKKDEIIIEIGSGVGSLTQKILNKLKSGYLLGIEKDPKLIKVLEDIFYENSNFELIEKDVRDINWIDFFKKRNLSSSSIKVLGNLPYYITTPIIMGLLEEEFTFSKLVFMVQKEVAERMTASPGGKDYGTLSIGVQYYSKPKIMFEVSPEAFLPKPEVNSSVIVLNPYIQPPYEVENKEFFFKIVKAIFQLRRKNIKNSLVKGSVINIDKDLVLQGLKQSGIDSRIRGEKLSIEKMVHFSNVLYNILKERSDNSEIYQSL